MKGENMDTIECPICGCNEMAKRVIKEEFEYKGQILKIDNYVIFECPGCEESIVDKSTLKNSGKIIRDFHREVDGLLTSYQIKKIRTSLGFKQTDFGILLGGGEKSFARYESCAVTQSRSMDNLLRILDESPAGINILRHKQTHTPIAVSPFSYNYAAIDMKVKF
jgi:HTH-type transcriptional regulator/antitoxin MqsA